MLECGDKVPTFVAKELDRLPPVGFDNLDVSSLLGRLLKLECEMADMKLSMQSQAKAAENLQNTAVTMDTRVSVLEVQKAEQSAGSDDFPDLGATDAAAPAQTDLPSGSVQAPWSEVVRRGGKKKTPPVGGHPPTPAPPAASPRQPKRKPGIVGTASTGRIQAIKTKLVSVFATRFDPELDADTLGVYLKEQINATVTCRKIVSERSRFASFHVTAECKDVDAMYDPDVWPEGVFVRRYYEPRKQRASLPGAESLRKGNERAPLAPTPASAANAANGVDQRQS